MFHFVTFCEGGLEVKRPEGAWAGTSFSVEYCAEDATVCPKFNAEARG